MANSLFRGVITKFGEWLHAPAGAIGPNQSDLPPTERHDPKSIGMQGWDEFRLADHFFAGQVDAARAARAASKDIAAAARAAADRLATGATGRIVQCGSGTPKRLGELDNAELPPTFGWPKSRIASVTAGGVAAQTQAIENAEDDVEDAIRQVAAAKIGPDDVFIATTSRGNTPFTVAAAREAKKRGALVIGIANVAGSDLLSVADHPVLLDTGPEPISGSTRMKAGTAQKIAMNVLSSMIMTFLGRVHDGYMVNMIPTNAKLRVRQPRNISDLTGCTVEDASTALAQARDALGPGDENIAKLAILIVKGHEVEAAKQYLATNAGRLPANLSRLTPL